MYDGPVYHPGKRGRNISNSRLRSALDLGNLGSFDAQARHQALLIENESMGIVLQRRSRQVLGDSLVHYDDRRPDADFPALCIVDVAHGIRSSGIPIG